MNEQHSGPDETARGARRDFTVDKDSAADAALPSHDGLGETPLRIVRVIAPGPRWAAWLQRELIAAVEIQFHTQLTAKLPGRVDLLVLDLTAPRRPVEGCLEVVLPRPAALRPWRQILGLFPRDWRGREPALREIGFGECLFAPIIPQQITEVVLAAVALGNEGRRAAGRQDRPSASPLLPRDLESDIPGESTNPGGMLWPDDGAN